MAEVDRGGCEDKCRRRSPGRFTRDQVRKRHLSAVRGDPRKGGCDNCMLRSMAGWFSLSDEGAVIQRTGCSRSAEPPIAATCSELPAE